MAELHGDAALTRQLRNGIEQVADDLVAHCRDSDPLARVQQRQDHPRAERRLAGTGRPLHREHAAVEVGRDPHREIVHGRVEHRARERRARQQARLLAQQQLDAAGPRVGMVRDRHHHALRNFGPEHMHTRTAAPDLGRWPGFVLHLDGARGAIVCLDLTQRRFVAARKVAASRELDLLARVLVAIDERAGGLAGLRVRHRRACHEARTDDRLRLELELGIAKAAHAGSTPTRPPSPRAGASR